MATPGASKKKCRQYSVEYLKYGFLQSPTNPQQPMCLVCEKNFSNEAMKPSRLLEHLQKIPPDKSGKTLAFFHSLRDQFLKRKTMNMFTSSSKNSDASYNISLLIAKAGKPHTIGEENRSEGRWHCRVLRSFSGTPQGYVSQIQRPIFSWNPWLGDRSVYWNQHRGANPSRRGTCKFSKWWGSETKVQNLLPSLLDANSDPKTLPNPVERHQVVFHCFSDFLPGWEGIQRCVQAPHQTKKQTQRNRAWWSETAPDKPSSWC